MCHRQGNQPKHCQPGTSQTRNSKKVSTVEDTGQYCRNRTESRFIRNHTPDITQALLFLKIIIKPYTQLLSILLLSSGSPAGPGLLSNPTHTSSFWLRTVCYIHGSQKHRMSGQLRNLPNCSVIQPSDLQEVLADNLNRKGGLNSIDSTDLVPRGMLERSNTHFHTANTHFHTVLIRKHPAIIRRCLEAGLTTDTKSNWSL